MQAIDSSVTYLMTLYLHPTITPETIIEAKKAGISGVKSYPAGVTTNSAAGVVDYSTFYPVFAEMERQDLVLNLHGEQPDSPSEESGDEESTTVFNAESKFLPKLFELHRRFPSLRIVLEHLTTAAAVEAVLQCGSTVAATITAHHLHIIKDDWAGEAPDASKPVANAHNYCKPVAKFQSDRVALLRAATSGNPKFFFGSDSAPHPIQSKAIDGGGKIAAGVFTQPYTTALVMDAFEKAVTSGILADEQVTLDVVAGFLGNFGRRFYGLGSPLGDKISLSGPKATIRPALRSDLGDVEVIPFRAGEQTWTVSWG